MIPIWRHPDNSTIIRAQGKPSDAIRVAREAIATVYQVLGEILAAPDVVREVPRDEKQLELI